MNSFIKSHNNAIQTVSNITILVHYLYVLRDAFSLCSWDVCLCVGSWLQPKGNQPAYEDDSGLKETLLGAVKGLTTVLLPAYHTVVRLRTHRRHVYRERGKSLLMWCRICRNTTLLLSLCVPVSFQIVCILYSPIMGL